MTRSATSFAYDAPRITDEVFCLAKPETFSAVGQWYEDFRQVSDAEACQLLDGLYEHARERLPA